MKIAITLLSCCLSTLSAPAFCQDATPPAGTSVAAPEATAPSLLTAEKSETSAASAQTVSVSQVRIVRLSQVMGQVELDRQTGGPKFDLAFVNLPIVAGAALRTKQGLAEVEFEDNSSLRLTPESQVEFPHLGRSLSGSTITDVNLVRGSLYVSLADGKFGGDFTVRVGSQSIVVSPSTHLRLGIDSSTAKMVVFQGSATVSGPSGSVVVTKKKAISFDTASTSEPQFVQAGEGASFDNWDKNAVDYHKARSNALVSGLASSSYSYGLNDLNYYGSFSDIGGCGTMWRPHLANAAFDPYSSGVWSWYPGQGYSWVSLYPWGWTPFHSGSWDYCPAGGGWGWRPQGTWRGVLNHPMPVRGSVRPHPPLPPRPGQPTLIGVNLNSLQHSQQGSDGKFVFRAGSAGLGVPRGTFKNLGTISQHTETRGISTISLSEHQAQVGLLAPSHSSMTAYSSSASASSAAHTGSAPVSSSFASSHSSSTVSSSSSPVSSSFSGGSFTSTPSASSVSSASSGASSHH